MLQGSSDGEMAEEEGSVLRAKVKRLAAFLRASKYDVEPAFLQQQRFLIFEDHPESGPSKPRAKQLPSRTALRWMFRRASELFGESLPAKEVKSAWEHTSKADLALVLRSSLRVSPALAMPGQVARNGGRLVIVNLQRTRFDGQASLVICARCDEVMRLLVEQLHLEEEQPSLSGENPSPLLEESASKQCMKIPAFE